MNQHLSQQQIDEWLVNRDNAQRPDDVAAHLRSCPECSGELSRTAEALTLFGGAVRSWGEDQMRLRPARATWTVPVVPVWRWRVALAFAVMWFMIAVPVYQHRKANQEAAALRAAQDEILLQHVEQALSQSVPSPMEPLAKLMPNDFTR